jgi:hypothetical protein
VDSEEEGDFWGGKTEIFLMCLFGFGFEENQCEGVDVTLKAILRNV